MKRARETGIRFNPDKCQIACTELPFFGHLLTASGLQADLRKIEAIHNMDPSTSLADLQTFLGKMQFLSRFVIPKLLQPEVLNQLHYVHQDAEKCKLRAKGSVFWANINVDIEETVKMCSPCQHNQKMNIKEPLTPHDVSPRSWHTLAADLFFWNNDSYLLVVIISASFHWFESLVIFIFTMLLHI